MKHENEGAETRHTLYLRMERVRLIKVTHMVEEIIAYRKERDVEDHESSILGL